MTSLPCTTRQRHFGIGHVILSSVFFAFFHMFTMESRSERCFFSFFRVFSRCRSFFGRLGCKQSQPDVEEVRSGHPTNAEMRRMLEKLESRVEQQNATLERVGVRRPRGKLAWFLCACCKIMHFPDILTICTANCMFYYQGVRWNTFALHLQHDFLTLDYKHACTNAKFHSFWSTHSLKWTDVLAKSDTYCINIAKMPVNGTLPVWIFSGLWSVQDSREVHGWYRARPSQGCSVRPPVHSAGVGSTRPLRRCEVFPSRASDAPLHAGQALPRCVCVSRHRDKWIYI